MKHGHRGPIQLFHGALHSGGLYIWEELRRLARRYSHVEYTPAVLNGDESEGVTVGSLDQVVLKRFPKLSGWRGYICGDPALVHLLKKKLFLSGMASRDIYADAFLPAQPLHEAGGQVQLEVCMPITRFAFSSIWERILGGQCPRRRSANHTASRRTIWCGLSTRSHGTAMLMLIPAGMAALLSRGSRA